MDHVLIVIDRLNPNLSSRNFPTFVENKVYLTFIICRKQNLPLMKVLENILLHDGASASAKPLSATLSILNVYTVFKQMASMIEILHIEQNQTQVKCSLVCAV